MDYYISVENQVNRLITEWLKYGSLVIAYDYDNTVFDYHNAGFSFDKVITQLKILGTMGCTMICWSCSDPSRFPEMRDYLKRKRIPCHGINIDTEVCPFKGRKIYANVYYDDRAGLGQTFAVMEKVIKYIKERVEKRVKRRLFNEINTRRVLEGRICFYSGEEFREGEDIYYHGYPLAFEKYRKKNDIIPAFEKVKTEKIW